MPGDIPIAAVVHTKARDAGQVVEAGHHPRQKAPRLVAGGQGTVHILFNTLLRESPGQQIGVSANDKMKENAEEKM